MQELLHLPRFMWAFVDTDPGMTDRNIRIGAWFCIFAIHFFTAGLLRMFFVRNPLDLTTLVLVVAIPGSLLIFMWLALVLRKQRFVLKEGVGNASAGEENQLEMGLLGE